MAEEIFHWRVIPTIGSSCNLFSSKGLLCGNHAFGQNIPWFQSGIERILYPILCTRDIVVQNGIIEGENFSFMAALLFGFYYFGKV
jgi:hypothetical protein